MVVLRATVAVPLCLIAFFVPIALWPGLLFPFISAKAIVFRALLDLAFLPWLALLIFDPSSRPRWTRSAVMMVLTLLALLIADIGSAHPRNSFFSNFERMEGFVAWAYLGLFFFMMQSTMHGRWAPTFQWCLVASSVVVCLIAFIGWGPNRMQPNSTFGNPSYVGQYAAMMIFLALSLVKEVMPHFRSVQSLRPKHKFPPPATTLALGAAFLSVLAVFASGSRGALLALAVGAIIYCFSTGTRRRAVAILALAGLVATALLVLDQPLLLRIATLGTWDNRPHIWQTALEIARMRPIFGWGQEELRYAFCVVQDIDCPHVDRAHNLALDWLTQAGVVGAYCWAGFLLSIRREARETGKASAIYGLLAAYVAADLTLFDTLPVYLLLISTAAIGSVRSMLIRLLPIGTTCCGTSRRYDAPAATESWR